LQAFFEKIKKFFNSLVIPFESWHNKKKKGGNDRMDYQVGDIVKLKKAHPCGSHEWEILRVGMDFRLKCLGCGHQIMVSRKLVEKNTRGLRKPD